MVKCSSCGFENQENSRFCRNCGNALRALLVATSANGEATEVSSTTSLSPAAAWPVSSAATDGHYTTTTELFEYVRKLVSADRHVECLALLDAAALQATWSDDDRRAIQSRRDQVEIRQRERFDDRLHALQQEYLTEPLRPVASQEEMFRVEGRLQTLRAIDDRRPLADVEAQIGRLRQTSEVEWVFAAYDKEMRSALNEDANDPNNKLDTARGALNRLRTVVLPEWESRAQQAGDTIAQQVTPRLRELAAQASREFQALANRFNILTTLSGAEGFWEINEEYQRWINPPLVEGLRVEAPTQMAKMIWSITTDPHTGEQDRKYVPEGPVLSLPDWYDSFLNDATKFARDKGERDVQMAEAALQAGDPLKAQVEARKLLEGDPVDGKRPYFNLPDDIKRRARALLDSEQLKFQLRRLEEARNLLHEADRLRLTAPLTALETFRQAVSQPLNLIQQIPLVREPLLIALSLEIETRINQDRLEQLTDPQYVQERLQEVRRWLSQMPNLKLAHELQQQLDPDGQLAELRKQLEVHERYCQIWLSLATIEHDKWQLPLRELASRLDDIKAEIERANLTTADFRLFDSLQTYFNNEKSEHGRIDAQLQDPAIFTPDTDDTNVELLLIRLSAARESRHSRANELVQALEARYALYQEKNDRDTLTFEARRALLQRVLRLEHVPGSEQELARRRLEALEQAESASKAVAERISTAEAWANAKSLAGFQRAWTHLNEVRSIEITLMPEILAAQGRIREKARVAVAELPRQYQRELGEADVRTLQAWIALIREMGIGDAEQSLVEHFNPTIWRWEARPSAPLEERFRALAHLADHEPGNNTWIERASKAGVEWVAMRLEQLRKKLMQLQNQHTLHADPALRPESVLAEAPANMQHMLYVSPEYQSKVAELCIWLDDLSNARYIIAELRSQHPAFDSARTNILTLNELEDLLALAEVNQRIQQWILRDERPTLDRAKELRRSYDTVLHAN